MLCKTEQDKWGLQLVPAVFMGNLPVSIPNNNIRADHDSTSTTRKVSKMNMQPDIFSNNGAAVGASILVIAGFIRSFAVMIFWMVVGWRAMKAHELLAASSLGQLEHIQHGTNVDVNSPNHGFRQDE